MGPYAVLLPESTPTHLPWAWALGQPYARVYLNPMLESTLSPMIEAQQAELPRLSVLAAHFTVKKVIVFPIPGRDVTNQKSLKLKRSKISHLGTFKGIFQPRQQKTQTGR
jgi:hypothetical protein